MQILATNELGLSKKKYPAKAEYTTFSADKALATMPENITYVQAAASVEGAHYALNFINKVNIKPRQKALVNGAAGAIGSAVVQFLKYYGASATAVCSTKNIELIRSIGADKVIDYTNEDFTLSEEKYDYVLDAVGKSTFAKCRSLLQPGGVYLSSELGAGAQNLFLALLTPVIASLPGLHLAGKVKFPFPSDCKRSVIFVKKLTEEGKFSAVIDRTYPLEEIADAYRYVETGQKTGNVVIVMDEESKVAGLDVNI